MASIRRPDQATKVNLDACLYDCRVSLMRTSEDGRPSAFNKSNMRSRITSAASQMDVQWLSEYCRSSLLLISGTYLIVSARKALIATGEWLYHLSRLISGRTVKE